MTLYDITLTHEDTYERTNNHWQVHAINKRLTVTITPYEPMDVPPGSTLVLKHGPPWGTEKSGTLEAVQTDPDTFLVRKGDGYYTNSRIIDGHVLMQTSDAAQYLAQVGEDLIVESLRAMAQAQVKEA